MEKEATYLTTTAVARMLNVSSDTVRLWARKGKLPVERTAGGIRLFLRAAVEKLLAEREKDRGN